jgi:hypothetical protein
MKLLDRAQRDDRAGFHLWFTCLTLRIVVDDTTSPRTCIRETAVERWARRPHLLDLLQKARLAHAGGTLLRVNSCQGLKTAHGDVSHIPEGPALPEPSVILRKNEG